MIMMKNKNVLSKPLYEVINSSRAFHELEKIDNFEALIC